MVRFRVILSVVCIILSFAELAFANAKDNDFTVVLDAGHGGHDPGAVGANSKEKDINLAVVLLAGEYISKAHPDVKVMYTRKNDKFIGLNERSNFANKNKADLFISVHTNSAKARNAYGTETFTMGTAQSEENMEVAKRENQVITFEDNYKEIYQGFDPNSDESYILFKFMQNKFMAQSVSLASFIQDEFRQTCKRSNRGVHQANFLVLRTTSMPSVLIELGFISNREEEKYLNSQKGKTELAQSICTAFTQYKKKHDLRIGKSTTVVSPTQEEQETVVEENKSPMEEKSTAKAAKGQLIHKVQILANTEKLPANSPLLKGHKADYYKEGAYYKYTCGETSDWSEIQKLQKNLAKQFKGAFIVTFKDGVKVPFK